MKKLILSSALVAFIGLTNLNAQEVKSETKQATEQEPGVSTKQEVKLSDLPEAIRKTLTADLFNEWVPTKAFHVKDGSVEYYQIDVKKEDETKSVKLDINGKVIN